MIVLEMSKNAKEELIEATEKDPQLQKLIHQLLNYSNYTQRGYESICDHSTNESNFICHFAIIMANHIDTHNKNSLPHRNFQITFYTS